MSEKPYHLNAIKTEPRIGKIDLQDLREIQKNLKDDEKRDDTLKWMEDDKKQLYKVITETVGDIVAIKRGRGRPIGSKNKEKPKTNK